MTFDERAASKPKPTLALGFDDIHVYDDGPITYLFAGAISADRDPGAPRHIREWYLRRIIERVDALTRS